MIQATDNNNLTLPVRKRDHIQGPIDAPVVLVEYGDYECLYCGQAYLLIKEIQRRLGNKLCFVFRHFPLIQLHPHTHKAALVAEVAGAQGKFWQMHDTLFEHQQTLDDCHLVEYAVELELDITRFLRDMSGRVYAKRVQQDFESGVSSGVSSTPTFFINSFRYSGACHLEELLAVIVEADELCE